MLKRWGPGGARSGLEQGPRASPGVAQSGPGARVSAAPVDAPSTPPLQAKTKGLQSGVDIGVKYSEKQERNFDDATMKAGHCVIGLQVGSRGGVGASQVTPGPLKLRAASGGLGGT